MVCFKQHLAAHCQGIVQHGDEGVLHQAVLVVLLLGPGVREKIVQAADAARGYHPFQKIAALCTQTLYIV